jgi:hypothetical protein
LVGIGPLQGLYLRRRTQTRKTVDVAHCRLGFELMRIVFEQSKIIGAFNHEVIVSVSTEN